MARESGQGLMSKSGYNGKRKTRWSKGFAQAGGLVQPQIKRASESRGFAVSRLVTHWAEVVGPDIARLCRPVKVGYARQGMGATLTLLARGAAGPMLQPQLPAIRDRVNACYGYNAVSQIRITQTAATGFGEGQAGFDGPARRVDDRPASPGPEAQARGAEVADEISDPGLRAALAGLGARVHARRNPQGDPDASS